MAQESDENGDCERGDVIARFCEAVRAQIGDEIVEEVLSGGNVHGAVPKVRSYA